TSPTLRCVSLAVSALALLAPPAAAQSLLTNGSFEQGAAGPSDWQLLPGGSWGGVSSHRGARHLHGASAAGAVVGTSPRVELVPEVEYRLEGWVGGPTGKGRLELELLDDGGTARQAVAAPVVATTDGWRYVAVEFAATQRAGRVQFWAQGASDLDDVAVVPIAGSYLGNKGVAADS